MGYFKSLALNVTVGDMREEREMDKVDGIAMPRYGSYEEAAAAQAEAQRTSEHALVWFQPLCEKAAQAERERTGHFGKGVTRRFDADTIACVACQTVIRNGGTKVHSLLDEINADMVRRNPRLADGREEWETEWYR